MPYKQTGGSHVNTATGFLTLLTALVDFLTNANTITTPAAGGGNTGNGTLDSLTADESAPTEDWTLTCTTGGGDATAIFSVVGSVSGNIGNATSGTAFNGVVNFTINAGGTAWVSGDVFTFSVTQTMGTDVWENLKDVTSGLDSGVDREVYLKAKGPSDTEDIHVNIRAYSSAPGNRYNWEIQGATAFNTGLSFDEQPGAIPSTVGVPQLLFWDSTINYVLVADNRRFVLVAYAAGQPTQSCFAGWTRAFGSPTEYPAPLFVGGCHYDNTVNASNTDDEHVWFADNFESATSRKSQAHLRTPGGTWARSREARGGSSHDNGEDYCFIWPTGYLETDVKMAPGYGSGGDTYYFLPQVTVNLHRNVLADADRIGDDVIVGELQGLYWVTGFDLSTGDTITDVAPNPDEVYFVFNDTFRTSLGNYLALKLE